jgi:hypothetical protein
MNIMTSTKATLSAQIPAALEADLKLEIRRSEIEADGKVSFIVEDFDLEELTQTLLSELESIEDEYELSTITDGEGDLVIRALYWHIEKPEFQNLHEHFWANYHGDSKAVAEYIEFHMEGDLRAWVKNLLDNPEGEVLRASVLGGAEWDLWLLAAGIEEALNEYLAADELDFFTPPVELLGNGSDLDDLKIWAATHQHDTYWNAKFARFNEKKKEFLLANA